MAPTDERRGENCQDSQTTTRLTTTCPRRFTPGRLPSHHLLALRLLVGLTRQRRELKRANAPGWSLAGRSGARRTLFGLNSAPAVLVLTGLPPFF